MGIYITFQAKSYLSASGNIFRTNCTSHDINIPMSHSSWSCAIMMLTLVSSRTADSPDLAGNDPSSLLKKAAMMLLPWQLLHLTAWLQMSAGGVYTAEFTCERPDTGRAARETGTGAGKVLLLHVSTGRCDIFRLCYHVLPHCDGTTSEEQHHHSQDLPFNCLGLNKSLKSH